MGSGLIRTPVRDAPTVAVAPDGRAITSAGHRGTASAFQVTGGADARTKVAVYQRIQILGLIGCALLVAACVRPVAPSAPSAPSGTDIPESECIAAVLSIQTAVARQDHAYLTSLLDDYTNESLTSLMKYECSGLTQRLMDILYISRHPARFKQSVRIGPSRTTDGYRTVTLTAPYSYLDGRSVPACGERPLELCAKFMRGSDGRILIHLDYDFHDILYLLQ